MIPEVGDDCYSGSSDGDEFAAFLEQTLQKQTSQENIQEDHHIQGQGQGATSTQLLQPHQQRNNTETATAATVVVARETGDDNNSEVDVTCPHPIVLNNLCSHCGEAVEESGSRVPFNYIYKDLMVEPSEADKLGKKYTKQLLKDKKLILVLDLDHTLINSVYLDDLIEDEEYLLDEIPKEQEELFQLEEYSMLTKLRPFVGRFLEEANKMFEMYVYTTGERGYADEIAKLLDPCAVYFPLRVICRSDSTTTNQKGLDIVIGPDNLVIVLDDSKHVWEEKHRENIIEMQPYNYFAYSVRGSNTKSLTQSNIDESESDGILASILTVLRLAHDRFYDPEVGIELGMRDVREILATIKREVLKGCHILVTEEEPNAEAMLKLAEGMGAVCYSDEDDSVTHVVATLSTTITAEWARDNNKLLVSPHWIQKAHYLWKRQEEEDFPVL